MKFDLEPFNEEYFAVQMQEKLSKSVSEIFATIHGSVVDCSKRMLVEMKRINYVTAMNFLTLSAGYKESVESCLRSSRGQIWIKIYILNLFRMLNKKRVETADAANKLRNGLYKIEETREKVDSMRIELKIAQTQGIFIY